MQVENHKEEVPFSHYEGLFRNLDPQAALERLPEFAPLAARLDRAAQWERGSLSPSAAITLTTFPGMRATILSSCLSPSFLRADNNLAFASRISTGKEANAVLTV